MRALPGKAIVERKPPKTRSQSGMILLPEVQSFDNPRCTVLHAGVRNRYAEKDIPSELEVGDGVWVLPYDGEEIPYMKWEDDHTITDINKHALRVQQDLIWCKFVEVDGEEKIIPLDDKVLVRVEEDSDITEDEAVFQSMISFAAISNRFSTSDGGIIIPEGLKANRGLFVEIVAIGRGKYHKERPELLPVEDLQVGQKVFIQEYDTVRLDSKHLLIRSEDVACAL